MVNVEPGQSREYNSAPQGVAERLSAARYILLAAAAMLLAGVAVLHVPLVYAVAGFVFILIVAMLPARARSDLRTAGAGGGGRNIWPDTAMKATVEALSEARLPARCRRQQSATPTSRPRELFPATRPGDPFTLTFRRPEFADALELAGSGQTTSVEFREAGEAAPPTRWC